MSPSRNSSLIGIGALSRASGLSVSALRFYAREGLLRPAAVNPGTGYRQYRQEQIRHARMVAGMRRVQMGVADMSRVLEAMTGTPSRPPDPAAADRLLREHLERLRRGLDDAEREIARLGGLARCDELSAIVSVSVSAPSLVNGIAAVRHAMGTDPSFPTLAGILLEQGGEGLHTVACDRYRLAVARLDDGAPHRGHFGSGDDADPQPEGLVSVLLPRGLVDTFMARAAEWNEVVTITMDTAQGRMRISDGQSAISGSATTGDYPDYRRVLREVGSGARLDVGPLREHLWQTDRHTTHVTVDGDGICSSASPTGITVDRFYLWDALTAVGEGVLTLPMEGVIAPLQVRDRGGRVVTILMPVLPEGPGQERPA